MELKAEAEKNLLVLKKNPYSDGIIIGRDETCNYLIQVYWIMGWDENSRNRIFVEKNGEVKISPVDPAKVITDPSLFYTAMDQIYCNSETYDERGLEIEAIYAVSNGSQTTDALHKKSKGLLLDWQNESGSLDFIPRITARFKIFHKDPMVTEMFGIKKSNTSDRCKRLFFRPFLTPGFGYCITTYSGDGNPLPSFEGGPYVLPLVGDIENVANSIWSSLHPENRVSLAVKFINIRKGTSFTKIINKFEAV